MRNPIRFGYSPFGGKVLVKLNVKLSVKQCLELAEKFPGIVFWDNGKFGMAVEGILDHSKISNFHTTLNLLRIDAQIERLLDKKTAILDSFTKANIEPGSLDNPFL